MAYTPPSGTIDATWSGAPAYVAPKTGIRASWVVSTEQHVFQPQGIAAMPAGSPVLKWKQWIAGASAGNQLALGVAIPLLRPYSYRAPQNVINASWVGAVAYAPSSGALSVTWDSSRVELTPAGIAPPDLGTPVLLSTQFASPSGFSTMAVGDGYALFSWQYAPPEWIVNASWVGKESYAGHVGVVDGLWTLPSESKYLPLTGWASSTVGTPSLEGRRTIAYPSGIASPGFGTANLTKKATALLPTGVSMQAFGAAVVFNKRQYLRPIGPLSFTAGVPFLSGGVKYVTPNGMQAMAFGAVVVVNTKATRTLSPTGMATPGFGAASVSPRSLRPSGIAGAVGTPQVQRNPSPVGFSTMALGAPRIEYKTKYLVPGSIGTLDLGYPRVFDPTQKLFPVSLAVAGVFGDTRVANKSGVIRAPGIDYLEMSGWATVESNRRTLAAPGWNAQAFGDTGIRNKTPSLTPAGFDSMRAPGPATGIGYRQRSIRPSGLNQLAFGFPVLTKTPEIAPLGIGAAAAGVPTIWPRVRTIEAKGSNHAVVPDPTAWFRYRFVAPAGAAAALYGNPRIEHDRRSMLAAGAQHSAYGTPSISNADRTIAPASIFEFFAASHMVGGTRFLRPVGFNAARFGTRIIPVVQAAYPQGFTGTFGQARLDNRRTLVKPPSMTTTQQPADGWGTARVWNTRQYVAMFYDPDSALNPPAWPQWTLIENRTRVMRATGNVMSRVPEPAVFNNARPLLPVAIAAPSMPDAYKAGLVAYRIRSFRLEGVEPPYMSSWARVHNDAAVIAPKGFVASLFGTARLENNRRYFPYIGGFDSAWFGYPMIADRVRKLEFEGRYTIAPPIIALPVVKLHTRYIEARGDDMFGQGWASLSIHFTRITPRWTLQNLYGTPAVKNLTPELRTRGRNTEEFGDTSVRLQWRPVAPYDTFMQLMGRPTIADRNRSMTVTGFRAGIVSDKHKVVKTGAPPYSTQYIWLDGTNDGGDVSAVGDGIPIPKDQVPAPIMNQQVIYVRQTDASTRFGSARITANTIRMDAGYHELLVGDPMVSLRIRTVEVAAFDDDQVFLPGNPRLSPHTIYAVMEAPEQAKDNHPSRTLHYVDGWNRTPGTIFGRAAVTLRQRRMVAADFNASSYGTPSIANKRHYIDVNGWTSMRFGWHVIPGPQFVEQYESSNNVLWGVPKVARPPYIGPQTIRGIGLASQAFGRPLVEFFNREVKPSGYLATLMGTRLGSDSPYMWQGLRVGPLMPTIPAGFSPSVYGTPWVSFRVREVNPVGFDSFLAEYELEAFDKRMRVTRRTQPVLPRALAPVGIYAFESSVSDVKPGTHFIRPDGNADQFRKGAF